MNDVKTYVSFLKFS